MTRLFSSSLPRARPHGGARPQDGEAYYVDHNTATTHWDPPPPPP